MMLPVIGTLGNERGPLGTAVFGVERQIEKVFRATVAASDEMQRKSIDLMFDFLTMRPLREVLNSYGLFEEKAGPGYQSQPELEYLKAVNDAGPAGTTLMILALTVQYSNLNRQEEGIERFESYLQRYDAELEPRQRAVYLSCLALLRADRAQNLPPWQLPAQIDLVQRLLAELREAKELTIDEPDFSPNYEKLLPRWISGLLLTNLPWPFGNKEQALKELAWAERTITQNSESRENAFQFLREVYYNLSLLYRDSGNQEQARRYLDLSGYKSFDKENIFLSTVFATTPDGLRDGIKQVKERVPGKVFTISGFDMSEFNFIVSDDGRQLIAVDAGTREDTAEAAYRYFERYYLEKYGKGRGASELPKLTKVFVTHYHWDHVGGHPFFRRLNERVEFYSRSNYYEESERAQKQPPPFKWTVGVTFNPENMRSYVPTNKVERDTEMVVGGTTIRLILPQGGGGETPDGMLVYLPRHRVLYVGDFIVPWVGSPYVVEGDVDSLLATLDLIADLEPQPEFVLHGHWALTQFYPTMGPLIRIRPHLRWLRDETLKHIYAYRNRSEIQRMNLIPPDLLKRSEADIQFPYIAMREVFINRLYSQKNGYWGPQLQNVDYLSDEEIGAALRQYLKLSEDDIAAGIEGMIQRGDYELAGRMADWSFTSYPNSARLQRAREEAFLQLKQKWQLLNVFKFVMYSEHINNPTPQTGFGESDDIK
jgi:glyoxylase-like metal-dependent hydrolase (beta-lactamase superfamily II)